MPRKLIDVLNEANPNKLADACRAVGLGNAIANGPITIKYAVTSNKVTLPDGFKVNPELGRADIAVYATAGTVTGKLALAATTTPATGEFAITVGGDLAFFAADAVTAVEIRYVPVEGSVIDQLAYCDGSGVVSVAQLQGNTAIVLLAAEQKTGAAINTKTVVARGTAAPTAGQAAILANGTIKFNAEAANAQVRVKYVAFPSPSILDKLNSTAAF